MKTPRIVVVGSVNTDMVVKTQWIPKPGETVTGGQFVMAAGGKGANQAVAAARLGAEVTFVAKVGQDMFGDQAIANYQKEGIDTDFIVRDPQHATGVALILVDDKGENLISVASGANHALTPADVDRAAERDPRGRHGHAPVGNPHGRRRARGRAGRRGRRAGDPRIRPRPPPLSPEVLRHVTYLTPNESEAERLTGMAVTRRGHGPGGRQKLLASGVRLRDPHDGREGGAAGRRPSEIRVVPASASRPATPRRPATPSAADWPARSPAARRWTTPCARRASWPPSPSRGSAPSRRCPRPPSCGSSPRRSASSGRYHR